MKILITGNRDKDLTGALVPLLESAGHECTCVSRSTGYDFEDGGAISKIVKLSESHDIFINMYANYFFKASVLTMKIQNDWHAKGYSQRRILTIGSTTDRVRGGKMNLYHYEKLALREMSQGLAIVGVWNKGPKVTHISYGTLSNRSADNPGRKCLTLDTAANYILWVLQQPASLNINEISIDPIQD